MIKILFLLISLISLSAHSQNVYYVNLSGNDSNDGLTENTAWKTFSFAASSSSPVTSGDTVYIKAGDYGYDDIFIDKNYSVNDARISFIGYQNVPGDITSFDFVYGNNVDPTLMPLINPNNRTVGEGINLSDVYSITIKNIQITNSLSGISIWNSSSHNSNHTLENIFLQNIGWEYSTAISLKEANNCSINNCLIVNATGSGIDAWGDNNYFENCNIYSNESQQVPDGTYTSMDYYIVLKGSNSTVKNCYAERDGDLEDVGHGLEIKESGENNLFLNCTVKNMIAGCFSVRWSGVKNNEFKNCHALGGVSNDVSGFMVREGANHNTFTSCTSDGCEAGIRFLLAGEDIDTSGYNNSFINCLIKNSEWAIDLNPYFYNSAPVIDNVIANCVIDNSNYLFNCERPNSGNQLINCIVTNVNQLSSGNSTLNFNYLYSDFYNNGFAVPTGTGNISDNPLFVDESTGNYHLQELSPCIDSGTLLSYVLVDFDGISRPQGAGYDMGIYEYNDNSGTSEFDVDKIKIYPNPTNGKVNVSSQFTGKSFSVIATNGAIVKTGLVKNNEIDLSALTNGLYYIVINTEENIRIPVVVERK